MSVVPPEQSADLRDYYNKHTKTDRLDSKMLARMPMLHPDGLRRVDSLGPADPLKRAVRHRTSLQKRRVACASRLDAFLELLGPGWLDLFGTVSYGKTAVAVLERYANPHALRKLGRARLTKLVIRASRGAWREAKADEILAAANENLALWAAGGLDFDELAEDIAIEVRQIKALRESFDAPDAFHARRRLVSFYEYCATSDVPELKRLAHTIARWETPILRWHRTRLMNAATEGTNLVIKNIKRLGFGFRNLEEYRLRLLLRCGAPWQHRHVTSIRPRRPRFIA